MPLRYFVFDNLPLWYFVFRYFVRRHFVFRYSVRRYFVFRYFVRRYFIFRYFVSPYFAFRYYAIRYFAYSIFCDSIFCVSIFCHGSPGTTSANEPRKCIDIQEAVGLPVSQIQESEQLKRKCLSLSNHLRKRQHDTPAPHWGTFITRPTGGGGYFEPPSDLWNYWADSKNSSGIWKPWKNCQKKTNFIDLGVTSDVTGQVKVKMFDISGLVTWASKIAMLSTNKAN